MLSFSVVCRRLVLAALLVPCLLQAAEPPVRPKIGLVLGGGGARGAAHIGVLEVLEKMRVPVDCIAGTSMGALVAGAYAAGVSPGSMRQQMAAADWSDMFLDNPEYSEMSYRNKVISRRFQPGSETGVVADGVRYQPGVVAGQKIKLFFNELVRANQGERIIEQLPLPLAIIATDIGSGERVVFRDGSLTKAMRASMSVPGLMAPIEHQGRKLVDGGLVDNVPIGEVRNLCQADVVIVVNVGSPLLKADNVGSLLTVSAQMVNILTEQNVTRSLATLKPTDVYIKPELDGITAGDFERNAETAELGRRAAEALSQRLAALSVPEAAYAGWWATIAMAEQPSPVIDTIEVVGLKNVNPAAVERHLHMLSGEPLKRTELNRDILRMYGDGYYEHVDYTVLNQRDKTLLRVMPVEKNWGPDYIRFAMNLNADTSQGSNFALRGAYHKTLLNDLGAELLLTGEIGTASRIGVNYYQPLDARQRFFVETALGYTSERMNIYQDDKRIAQYRNNETFFGLWAGAQVGLLGQLKLGWIERQRSDSVEIGAPWLPAANQRFGGWKAMVDFDQFDRMYFPTRGWASQMSYFHSPEQGYDRTDVSLQGAYAFGRTVFNGRLRYTGSPAGRLPYYDSGTLGGFLNLSAYANNQVLADDIRYAGLRAERIVGRLPLGLRGDMRMGMALEFAEVSRRYTETNSSRVLNSLALYFGVETPIGPTYLGLGVSTQGVSNMFLFIGTP